MQRKTLKKSDLRLLIRLFAIVIRQQKPMEADAKRLTVVKLTIKEAAMRLKKDPSTLFRWRKQKDKLKPSYDGGGQPFYDENDVNDYLKRNPATT